MNAARAVAVVPEIEHAFPCAACLRCVRCDMDLADLDREYVPCAESAVPHRCAPRPFDPQWGVPRERP